MLKIRMNSYLIFIAYCFFSIYLNCSKTQDPDLNNYSELKAILDEKKNIWVNKDIHNYEYRVQKLCSVCMPEGLYIMKVLSDTIYSIVVDTAQYDSLNIDCPNYTIDLLKKMPTINGLFDIVENAINDKVYYLEVQYDSVYAYPILIEIDRDKDWIDDEKSYAGRDLKIL